MDNRLVWWIGVGFVVVVGLLAGGADLFLSLQNNWSPRDYVPPPGEVVVYPQGDPLYDAHYAQEVNVYNADALKAQSEAQFIDAQTQSVEWETEQGKFGVYSIFVVVIIGFFLLILRPATKPG